MPGGPAYHAWTHLPNGTDPLALPGAAARIVATTTTVSCGGGTGANTTFHFDVDYDNIGLTAGGSGGDQYFTLPATFGGTPNPGWTTVAYVSLDCADDAFFETNYKLWFKTPYKTLYFSDLYFDGAEFDDAGYEHVDQLFGTTSLGFDVYLNGGSDFTVVEAYVTVVFTGDTGPTA